VVAWKKLLQHVAHSDELIGRIIHAPQGTMMMHQNVSTLISILISGLDFEKRNKVVLTELNFPSVVYNWMAQRKRGGEIHTVRSRDGLAIEAEDLVRAIDSRTAAVSLDLVLFRSSALLDVAPVIEAAHRHGAVVILDAYQGTGAVPIDVRALDVDFLVGGSVKWLCGGSGAAYLYARQDLIEEYQPTVTGWFSDKRPFDFRVGEIDYAADAHRFMGGTPSVPALYAARAGYEIIGRVGVEAIREKSKRQTELLVELAREQGLKVNTPLDPQHRGGTVCVDFEFSEDASDKLIERGFIIDHRPSGGIRISPHFYNSDEECRAIMEEIRRLRASGKLKAKAGARTH